MKVCKTLFIHRKYCSPERMKNHLNRSTPIAFAATLMMKGNGNQQPNCKEVSDDEYQ